MSANHTGSIAPALGHGPLGTDPGYQSAVSEESRSHDDVSSRATQSAAYRDLLDRLAEDAPHLGGYENAGQIGALSVTDLAAVLDEESTVISDATVDEALVSNVTRALRDPCHTEIGRAVAIGVAMLAAMEKQARTYLLSVLQERYQNEQERAWERQVERYYGSGDRQTQRERIEHDMGMGRMFK